LHVPDVIAKTFPHPDRQPDRLLNKLGSNERLLDDYFTFSLSAAASESGRGQPIADSGG
jgi:hypothetical protein